MRIKFVESSGSITQLFKSSQSILQYLFFLRITHLTATLYLVMVKILDEGKQYAITKRYHLFETSHVVASEVPLWIIVKIRVPLSFVYTSILYVYRNTGGYIQYMRICSTYMYI